MLTEATIAQIVIAASTSLTAIGVAVASGWYQRRQNLDRLTAEHRSVLAQLHADEERSVREARRRNLTESIAQLLTITDPDIVLAIDLRALTAIINRVGLQLHPETPRELALLKALNALGVVAQRVPQGGYEYRPASREEMLRAQSEVIECARDVVHKQLLPPKTSVVPTAA